MYKIQNHKVSENPLYRTHLDRDGYERMYRQSIEQPDMFWAEQANRFVEWMQPWSKVHESNMEKGEAAWFIDAKLNVSVNCIDRHLKKRADQTAIIWEGDDPAGQRAQATRRQQGRPGVHLHAHDSRSGLRHARLQPHWRHPLGGVRRFLPGRAA